MESYIKANRCTNMAKIEAFFQRRLLAHNNLSTIRLSSLNFNSKKTINFKKAETYSKKTIENSKINNKYINSNDYYYTNQNTDRTIPKLLKLNQKYPKRIISYRERNNKKLKYIKTEIKKDLKRYTKNSSTFKYFNELNKEYHPYTVNKAIRSILLETNKEKERETNNKIIEIKQLKSIIQDNSKIYTQEIIPTFKSVNKKIIFRNNFKINKNNKNDLNDKTIFRKTFTKKKSKNFKKKFSKLNINISPIKNISFNNKKKDIESLDEVDVNQFENDKLNRAIKISLLNDINHDEVNNKLYFDYLIPLTNRVNFHQDIYMVPHIKNNLALSQPFENLVLLDNKLRNKNLLHKQVTLSINRICIIKILEKKQRELEMKKYMDKNDYKPKRRWNNTEENYEKNFHFEKKFEHFELTDYFRKCNNYTLIDFADQKLKKAIFYKKFTKD